MKPFDDGLDALDWLLGTKVMGTILGHVLDGSRAAEDLIAIQRVAQSDGDAATMAKHWQDLQAHLGPPLVNRLLQSGEYREFCPTPAGAPQAPPLDDVLTVWSDTEGNRVVAQDKEFYFLFVLEAD